MSDTEKKLTFITKYKFSKTIKGIVLFTNKYYI